MPRSIKEGANFPSTTGDFLDKIREKRNEEIIGMDTKKRPPKKKYL